MNTRLMNGYRHARAMTAMFNRAGNHAQASWWADTAVCFLKLARKSMPNYVSHDRAMADFHNAQHEEFRANLDLLSGVVPGAAARVNFWRNKQSECLTLAASALNPSLKLSA